MSRVVLHHVGEIDLGDLTAMGRLQGHDGLPYPFASTRPRQQGSGHVSSVADRLEHEDLSGFREWTGAYVAAEIWVACRVHQADVETSDRRILAFRAGDAGYLATQRNDDVVEVSRLAASDLGAAIAMSIGLTEPGTHTGIVIPGYDGYFVHPAAHAYDFGDDDEIYSLRVAVDGPSRPVHQIVSDENVAAVATIQSRWQPARRWGVDWTKRLVACVQVVGDGDYVYTPDFSHAVPVTEQSLCVGIDALIAEDLSAMHSQRGIWT